MIDMERVFDPSQLRELSALDLGEEFRGRFIASCRRDLQANLQALSVALSKQDVHEAHERAHAMKGVALQLGLPQLASKCARLMHLERAHMLQDGAALLYHVQAAMRLAEQALDEYQREHGES